MQSNKMTVLYIESNYETREMYGDLMQQNGYMVLKTDNIITGYEMLKSNHIDILVLDLYPPNYDGLKLIKMLREKDIHIPVIIVASVTEKDVLLKAINLDIIRYIVKPFLNQDILDALYTASKKITIGTQSNLMELHDGCSYDSINKTVIFPAGKTIQLSKKEYLLLELLLKNKKQIIPYEEIERTLWEDNIMSIDALRTLVRGIRKKTYPGIISNHNSIGYKINL